MAFSNFESESFPPRKGVIRASTVISGYVIRKKADGSGCTMTMVSKTDVKGKIPKLLFNKTAQKAPLSWLKKFNKALVRLREGKFEVCEKKN